MAGLETEGAESVWGAVVTGRPTSPCPLSSPRPQQPDVRWQGRPAALGVGMFAVGGARCAWSLGFGRTLGCCAGSTPEAEGRAGDQDGGPVPQARLAPRSALETENHLARAAAFAKAAQKVGSEVLSKTFYFLLSCIYIFLNM